MEDTVPIELLRSLGLNGLEAEVYVTLLTHEPMTPYRVGTLLGRATANVYKAVESLSQRGAVLIEEGESRTCRAVPVRQFLRELEREFLSVTREAAAALSQLAPPPVDERVYRLQTVPQVIERASEMIETGATTILVIDGFPRLLAEILPSIRRAVRRHVRVYVQAYEPVTISGAHVTVTPVGPEAVGHWRSEQLNVVADGREQLLALVSSDLRTVYQAIWSQSLYLSCILHAGRVCEQTVQRLIALRRDRQLPKEVSDILDEHPFFYNSDVPGQKELLARHGVTPEAPGQKTTPRKERTTP